MVKGPDFFIQAKEVFNTWNLVPVEILTDQRFESVEINPS